ncbi:transmembrane protein 26-like [Ruditapes philippinarum]|uniref:transmembrane protein 26-like n=1 Tax=Ruditapes philippinarum TaxID=129788 RepID=UPI00295C01B4|nr:transmembrane protein 26-like [Ruditapes philippinarum]
MWKMRYDDYSEQGEGFYNVSVLPEDDKNSESTTYVVSWVDPILRPTSTRGYNIADTEVRINDVTLNDVRDDDTDTYSWVKVEDTAHLPGVQSVAVSDTYKDVFHTTYKGQNTKLRVDKENLTMANNDRKEQKNKEIDTSLIYGNHCSIFLAFLVRLLLIGHNVFAVWRVTIEYNDYMYWLLAVTNFFLIFEGVVVIIRNAGKEYSWWSPCLLFYLAGTVPAVWFLQLNQYHKASTTSQAEQGKPAIDIWVILTAETLVFAVLISRWLLPRHKLSENVISDVLVEFIFIASDVMEFLAVFDNDRVRGDLNIIYVVLAVWTASLVQFVPVFKRKNRYRKGEKDGCVRQCCGMNGVKIIAICMNVFLQNLPFLVVRLYLIIEMRIITYSLIFFVLKNVVSLLFLFCVMIGIFLCQNKGEKSD